MLSLYTLLPSRVESGLHLKSHLTLSFPLFLQTSYSRSRKLTWTNSCRPSLNPSQMSPCRRRRAWKSPCPRESPTGPSRSHPWGPVRSQRVSSLGRSRSRVASRTTHSGSVENNRPRTRCLWRRLVTKHARAVAQGGRTRFTKGFMTMCCGAVGLDLSVPAQFPVAFNAALLKGW